MREQPIMLPDWWISAIEKYRANRIVGYLSKFVEPGETVLDCGCGSMIVAQSLRERSRVEVFGVDVINLNRTSLSLCLCAGERLSLANESVDTVLLVSVLHHTCHPVEVLRECLRVAKHRVIIQEDVFQSSLELKLLELLDWIGNRSASAEISLPFNFKSECGWVEIFESLRIDLAAVESVRPIPWQPSRHRLFVLDKEALQ